MTSLLLLSCRSPFLDDDKIYPPLANLYLKSYIEFHNPEVQVTLGSDEYDLSKKENFTSYDYIGVSVMTPQRDEAQKILEAAKTHNPTAIMIAGGPHVKHYLKEISTESRWDYLVPLDGERALSQILSKGATERVVRDVMGKRDITLAPRPDRSSTEAINLLSQYHYTLQGRKATSLMTARGCPEQCTFCEDAQTAVKWSSLENLSGELDDIKRLGYGGVYIFDDLFAIAQEQVRPICDELLKRELIFRCNGQVRYFTKGGDGFSKMLAERGCVEIAFGFESGSQRILDNVHKRTTVEMNYAAVKYAKEHGIKVKGFVMLGLPGENLETIAETERFIATSGMDDFQLAVYYPYRGTRIRDAIDKGESTVDLAFSGEGLGAYGQRGGSTEVVVRTNALSAEHILSERDRLVRTYKPKAHQKKWEGEDKFFDQHLA